MDRQYASSRKTCTPFFRNWKELHGGPPRFIGFDRYPRYFNLNGSFAMQCTKRATTMRRSSSLDVTQCPGGNRADDRIVVQLPASCHDIRERTFDDNNHPATVASPL